MNNQLNEPLEIIISKIKENKIKDALDDLILYTSENLFSSELKSAILLKARLSEFHYKENIGTIDNNIEINKIRSSILDLSFELKGRHRPNLCNHLNVVSPASQNDKILEIFEDVILNLRNAEKTNFEKKVDLYSKYLESSGFIKELVLNNIGKDLTKILFNKIISSPQLKKIEIEQLDVYPFSKDYTSIEKSLIISAITINVLNKFNTKLFEVLITFLLSFEDDIWEQALASLVIAAKEHSNKILLYPEIVKRLEKLREIKIVQEGINQIEIDLINKQSVQTIFCKEEDLNDYINSPIYWFLKFEISNEIVSKELENIPDIENIHILLKQLQEDRHITTPEKYWIIRNLHSFSKEKIEKLFAFLNNSINCQEDHRFDYFIRDYYIYNSHKHPENKINLQISLYEGNLKSIISNNYYIYKYLAKRAKKKGELKVSIEYYKKAINEDRWDSPCNFCWLISQLREIDDIESADNLSSMAYDIFKQSHFLLLQIEHKIQLQKRVKDGELLRLYIENHTTLEDFTALSNIFIKHKKYDIAIQLLEKSLQLVSDTKDRDFLRKELIKVCFVLNDIKKAKKYLNNIKQIKKDDYEMKVLVYLLSMQRCSVYDFFKSFIDQSLEENKLNYMAYLMDELVNKHEKLYQSNKYKDIIEFFDKMKTEQNNVLL